MYCICEKIFTAVLLWIQVYCNVSLFCRLRCSGHLQGSCSLNFKGNQSLKNSHSTLLNQWLFFMDILKGVHDFSVTEYSGVTWAEYTITQVMKKYKLHECFATLFDLSKNNSITGSNIVFKNSVISFTPQFKFLGINITSNLKWRIYVQTLCLNLNKVCYIIKSLRDELSFCILRNIYFARFQSLVRHGIIFWGSEKECCKVLQMQKRAPRTMKGVNR